MACSVHTARIVSVSALMVAIGACSPTGGGNGAAGAAPAPEELAEMLLTQDQIPSGSGLFPGPWEAVPGGPSGVVSEGDSVSVTTAICAESGGDISDAEPSWQASATFSGLVPAAEGGATPLGEVTFSEALYADEPAAVEQAFDALRDALTTCLVPEQSQDWDGGMVRTVAVEPFDPPPVGDTQYAVIARQHIDASGDAAGGRVTLPLVIFRQGEVLGAVLLSEIIRAEEPAFTEDDVAAIVEAAASELP